ncbi:MAG: hypothetical protein ACOCQR_03740 [bacterium]
MKTNLSRIKKRHKTCLQLFDETEDINYAMEEDSITSLFECEGFKDYEQIADFCLNNNIKKVYDIGCAFGHQSEIFLEKNINYVGINDCKLNFWNDDKFQYIVQDYPFNIEDTKNALAISRLCLGWNCYLYEGEKTFKEQFLQLSKDFQHCLLHIPSKNINFVNQYFANYKKIYEELIYFNH